MYALTGLYAESRDNSSENRLDLIKTGDGKLTHDTVIRCHSRNPSSGLVDHRYNVKIINKLLFHNTDH